MMDISAVNVSERIAVTEDGQHLPITNLMDEWGDETEDSGKAVFCVAGPDRHGMWVSVDLAVFKRATLQ